jgi:hypothetical protein
MFFALRVERLVMPTDFHPFCDESPASMVGKSVPIIVNLLLNENLILTDQGHQSSTNQIGFGPSVQNLN